jgi:hypothetical protein
MCAQVFCTHLGASFTVDTSRDDATGIAGTLAAGEESVQGDVLQGISIADNADG